MASNDDDEETLEKTLGVYSNRDKKLKKLTCEGFSHKFVDKIDALYDFDIMCAFCFLVVRETMQISSCGHTFCSSCWGDWLSSKKEGEEVYCPIDNELVDISRVFEDRKQDRLIQGLKVYCDNVDFGCKVTPELRYYQEHMDKCEYQTVSCELMCGKRLLLRCHEDHADTECPRRLLECEVCGSKIQAQLFVAHGDICTLKLLVCEFCRVDDIPRNEMVHHLQTDCTKVPTFCSFALIGCRDKVEREVLPTHHEVKSQEHLQFLNSAVYQLYNVTGMLPKATENPKYELPVDLWGNVQIESQATILWNELPAYVGQAGNEQETLAEKVTGLQKSNLKSQKKIRELLNETKGLRNENRRLLDEIHTQKQEVRDENLQLREDMAVARNDDNRKLYDELHAQKHELYEEMHTEMQELREENAAMREDMRTAHNKLTTDLEMCITRNSDCLVEGANNKTPCTWTVDFMPDTSERSKISKSCPKTSPSFYTKRGYRMYLCVIINPDYCTYSGQSQKYAIASVLLKGDNDRKLMWPYNGNDLDITIQVNGTIVLEQVKTKAQLKPTNDIEATGYMQWKMFNPKSNDNRCYLTVKVKDK